MFLAEYKPQNSSPRITYSMSYTTKRRFFLAKIVKSETFWLWVTSNGQEEP